MNYIRKLLLKLADARFGAAMRAVELPGACLGDLAADPGGAAAFFKPLRRRLALAAAAPGRDPRATAPLAAAEDFALRLERFFADMALHKTSPDAAVNEALLALQRACALTPALVSPANGAAAAEAANYRAEGRKSLRLAKAAADSNPADFPQNLKFSSMYSGLDAVFDALERYSLALAQASSKP